MNSLKNLWTKTSGKHASAARGVKAVSQGIALSAMIVAGAFYAFNHEHLSPTHPGDLLKLPSELASAPARVAAVIAPDFAPPPPVPGSLAAGIGQVLRRYTRDGVLADRIATALVTEGTKRKISPVLLVGVVLTENDRLQPAALSNVRATGLMQVMPFHGGKWGCGSSDLVNIESNICHGTSILADLMQHKHNIRSALQGYNGCVHGTNTPHCHTYTGKVLKLADQTSRQLSAIRRQEALNRSAGKTAD